MKENRCHNFLPEHIAFICKGSWYIINDIPEICLVHLRHFSSESNNTQVIDSLFQDWMDNDEWNIVCVIDI
jgi:hypothetical protein